MKTIIISLLALTLNLNGANAANNPTTGTNKASHAVVLADDTFKAVIEENRKLKLQLEALENQQAELESIVAYNNMMGHMMLKLEAQKLEDKKADIEAMNNYHKMMAAAMQYVKAK